MDNYREKINEIALQFEKEERAEAASTWYEYFKDYE